MRLLVLAAFFTGCTTTEALCECPQPIAYRIVLDAKQAGDLDKVTLSGSCDRVEQTVVACNGGGSGCLELLAFAKAAGTCRLSLAFKTSPALEATAEFKAGEGCCGGFQLVSGSLSDAAVGG